MPDWGWDPVGDAIGGLADKAGSLGYDALNALMGHLQPPSQLALMNPFEYGANLIGNYIQNAVQTLTENDRRQMYMNAVYGQQQPQPTLGPNPLGPAIIPSSHTLAQDISAKFPGRAGFIGPPNPFPPGYHGAPIPSPFVQRPVMGNSLALPNNLLLQLPPEMGQQYQQGQAVHANDLWRIIDPRGSGSSWIYGPRDISGRTPTSNAPINVADLFAQYMSTFVPPPVDEQQQVQQSEAPVTVDTLTDPGMVEALLASGGGLTDSDPGSSDGSSEWNDATATAPADSPTDPEAAYQSLPDGWVIYEDGSIGPAQLPPAAEEILNTYSSGGNTANRE